MSFRYIGSKSRVVEQILEHIGRPNGAYFIDAFCGTGAVAEAAASKGWPVHLNDHLVSATTMAAGRLTSSKSVKFRKLDGYEGAIKRLNALLGKEGFIWREYSPASVKYAGLERRYFSKTNAAKIDAIRAQIKEWHSEETISDTEQTLLIADLLGAINRVANIAGTFGCFLSKWTPQSKETLSLRARELKSYVTKIHKTNSDAGLLESDEDDLLYLDPPYTKRQYAAYYHILETVSLGDEPVVEGVAGLRPWKQLASEYCYKRRALNALSNLIDNAGSKKILLSYSNEGHMQLDALKAELKQFGSVKLNELAVIGRYRPNQKASDLRSSVSEYLISVDKASATKRKSRQKVG